MWRKLQKSQQLFQFHKRTSISIQLTCCKRQQQQQQLKRQLPQANFIQMARTDHESWSCQRTCVYAGYVFVCMLCVTLKAIYGQYFCLATGLNCMTNATSRPSAEALHFIMATEISNRNRSGDTTYTTNIPHIKANKCQLQLWLATELSCQGCLANFRNSSRWR